MCFLFVFFVCVIFFFACRVKVYMQNTYDNTISIIWMYIISKETEIQKPNHKIFMRFARGLHHKDFYIYRYVFVQIQKTILRRKLFNSCKTATKIKWR